VPLAKAAISSPPSSRGELLALYPLHLYPVAGRPGEVILERVGIRRIVQAHAAFYRKHLDGEYADVAKEFFRLFPKLK
jgi:hypothetical protein